MIKKLQNEILKKAFFIVGANPKLRNDDDPVALSAIKDAKAFISTLPRGMKPPSISAGTTAAPECILYLTWTAVSGGEIKSACVICKGNGLFDCSWDEKNGSTATLASIGLKTLVGTNLAEKVKNLKSLGLSLKPNQP
ncbi:hypothetical protein [Pseudomonas aeruginosa]|nr:hypothetical protein [Pseudomonas aeruginosa]HBN9782213.1 hypothetical protein [Pseudomonas aeruginosa]HBN9865272.1 hypothetical protein [Pseudomonas aeruginosa]HBN9896622.1 hypothetical protein [Pseudomonas aeruginosa]